MRYIAVVHSWFVHSKGFEVRELEVTNDKDAKTQADAFAHEVSEDFKSTAVVLLKIGAGERIFKPRRLTWKERILGRIE